MATARHKTGAGPRGTRPSTAGALAPPVCPTTRQRRGGADGQRGGSMPSAALRESPGGGERPTAARQARAKRARLRCQGRCWASTSLSQTVVSRRPATSFSYTAGLGVCGLSKRSLETTLRKRLYSDEFSEGCGWTSAMPGSRPRTYTPRSNWTPCTPRDVPRCLSSRPPAPSAIDRSCKRPWTMRGPAIPWWSGSLTGWRGR